MSSLRNGEVRKTSVLEFEERSDEHRRERPEVQENGTLGLRACQVTAVTA